MARRLLLAIPVVAITLSLLGLAQAATVTPATLTIQPVDIRAMQPAASAPIAATGTIVVDVKALNGSSGYALSTTPGTGTIVFDAGVTPNSVLKGWIKPISYGFTFTTDDTALGNYTATVSITGDGSNPANIGGTGSATVTASILANRELVVGEIGTSTTAFRVMPRVIITKSDMLGTTDLAFGTGSNPLVDGDSVATRINTNAKKKITTKILDPLSGKTLQTITTAYSTTPPTQFNDVDQSAGLGVKFAKAGVWEGTIDLSQTDSKGKALMLSNGEATSVGASLQEALMSYNVMVLERRKLKNTATLNVLLNAPTSLTDMSTDFVVQTSNKKNLDYLTQVTVAKDSPTLDVVTALKDGVVVGSAKLTETLLDEIDPNNFKTSVGMLLTTNLTSTSIYGKIKDPLVVSVPVVTAELDTAGDFKKDKKTGVISSAYKNQTAKIKTNIGLALFSPTAPTTFASDTVKLYGTFTAGTKLASSMAAPLASKLNIKDKSLKVSMAKNTTKYLDMINKGKVIAPEYLYGPVGSEAQVINSEELSDDAVVSMQWRKRTSGESFENGMSGKDSTMPYGIDWLTSDVVKVQGAYADGSSGDALADTTYVLRMSFDNRIALAHDGLTEGRLENEYDKLFIAQLKNIGGTEQWNKAGVGEAYFPWDFGTNVATGTGSFEEFLALAENSGKSLDDLVGSWGVETSLSKTGVGYSWVVVKGSGTFAVAPEPSTLVLLGTVGLGLIGYGVRRWRRRSIA